MVKTSRTAPELHKTTCRCSCVQNIMGEHNLQSKVRTSLHHFKIIYLHCPNFLQSKSISQNMAHMTLDMPELSYPSGENEQQVCCRSSDHPRSTRMGKKREWGGEGDRRWGALSLCCVWRPGQRLSLQCFDMWRLQGFLQVSLCRAHQPSMKFVITWLTRVHSVFDHSSHAVASIKWLMSNKGTCWSIRNSVMTAHGKLC